MENIELQLNERNLKEAKLILMDTLEMWREEDGIEENSGLIDRFLYLFQLEAENSYEQILEVFLIQQLQSTKLGKYASFFLTMYADFTKKSAVRQPFLKNISRVANFFELQEFFGVDDFYFNMLKCLYCFENC